LLSTSSQHIWLISISIKKKKIMLDNQFQIQYTELTSSESASVSGGANVVNFDLNSYVFVVGAGAVFNGGVTTNVVDIAFQQSVYASPVIINPK
jgi:hypothetical protein